MGSGADVSARGRASLASIAIVSSLAASGSLLPGCGAKTALDVPDASIDAATEPDAYVPPELCIEAPIDQERVFADFALEAHLRVADVMFVIDATASMRDEIEGVRRGLRDRVVPWVRRAIPDASFGVALYGEFPVPPHARAGSDVGPYSLRAPITSDVGRIEAALAAIPSWGNADVPEAGTEALYQVATGAGLSPFIEPSLGCPTGGVGGACFRPEAFHVILLVTDAPLHNGPPGVPPIADYAFTPRPHGYVETIRALAAIDALVIGLGASDPPAGAPMAHLRAVARDTGAIDTAGEPLAFDIGGDGDGIGSDVVHAIERLAEDVPLDVDAIVEDRPGDAIDASRLVVAVRPRSAEPPSGVTSIDDVSFLGVRPGTRLTFELELDLSPLPPSRARREIPARVIMRESGRARLDWLDVLIVVPGEDGAGCP